MAVNVSVQYNGGFLPRRDTFDPMLLPSGSPIKCHEEVLSLQPIMIPPKRFDIFFPLTGGCSEGLDWFRFFFKHIHGALDLTGLLGENLCLETHRRLLLVGS